MDDATRARYDSEWEKYRDKWTECMDTDALPMHEQVLHETFFGSEEIDRTLMLAVYDELVRLQKLVKEQIND